MNIQSPNKLNSNFNMSSMTDVVFLLLIFFMLTSTLVTVNAIDVLLPKASGKTENKQSLVITITKDHQFYIGNDQNPIVKDLLETTLLKKIDNGTQVQKHLVIRADKMVPYKEVVYVMDIANRNKIKMILAVSGR